MGQLIIDIDELAVAAERGLDAPDAAFVDGALCGPLLVATTGDRRSDHAVTAAARLARRTDATPHVLAVAEPLPPFPTSVGCELAPEEVELRRQELIRTAVETQVRQVAPAAREWPVHVLIGRPAPTIARSALERGASLIVMGIGRHTLLDRLFGSETALAVMRRAEVPVLAAADGVEVPPRTVVAAVDFGAASLRAVELALRLVALPARLSLVHVIPDPAVDLPSIERWQATYAKGVAHMLGDLQRRVGGRPSVEVELVALRGDPAAELLDFAAGAGADLLVAGSHGRSSEPGHVGQVTAKLVRGARCSVLVAGSAPPTTDH